LSIGADTVRSSLQILKTYSSLRYLISCLAGAALVLAFAPFFWSAFAFISLAILFNYWLNADAREAFMHGMAFGLGLFLAGVSWVYVSLSTYGGMPLWMGSIAVILFASVLAFFIAVTGYLLVRLLPVPGLHRLVVVPPCWVILEWLKSWIFTGFPWLEIAYTQTPTWLFALAPIGGVYLISFMVAVLACTLVYLLRGRHRVWGLIAFVFVWLVAWPLDKIIWSDDIGEPVMVGLVQANVPIQDKWQPAYRDRVIGQFVGLSQQLHEQSQIQLLIWPETALPIYLQQTDAAFWRSITLPGTALLTGLLDSPQPDETYNAAVLSCDEQQQVYRKRHLVPFGEYLPLRFLFNWVLEYLKLPMNDLSSWQGSQSLSCADTIKLSLSICYEDAFGSEWRANVQDATVLVNISEDAWFGDSLAPHQRLQMAQMRARELSRPLLRSANTGPSVVIDERGAVLAQTEQFKIQTLAHKVQPQTGDTPYKRLGNWVVLFSFALLLILYFRVTRKSNAVVR